MIFNEIIIFFFFFYMIFFSIIINSNSSLHLLLTAEILWITLYAISLLTGIVLDNLNLISLTFFFLVFSAIELGVGLIILLTQNIFNRTIFLNDLDFNYNNFWLKFFNHLYLNKIKWKK